MQDDNVTRDVAATYREIRLREGDHLIGGWIIAGALVGALIGAMLPKRRS